ncbi:ribosomal RNA small subunit methyltransferase A [Candidatus Falkowbacteria bacterium]|nr:ribosomal RNA small subunit methyltransferase A [Candidatus Falkowbacteria bacterium]
MNLTNPETIKNLCRKFGIRPSHKNGQNFLIDKNVLDKLIKSANLKPTDTVLEVGPGFGVITQELVKHAKKVVAVELDKVLSHYLTQYFQPKAGQPRAENTDNLEIINKDILKLDPSSLTCPEQSRGMPHLSRAESRDASPVPSRVEGCLKVVSNLPYHLTSRFLRNILSSSTKPTDMTLIIQKEVAERICAKPGGDMSLLSISVQFYGQPKIIEIIKPESFWPSPEVESAIIKIDNIKPRKNIDEKRFFQLARIGFSSRRKMLKNNLAVGLEIGDSQVEKILKSQGLNIKVRAQDLSIENWIELSKILV